MKNEFALFRRILANDLRIYFRSGRPMAQLGGGAMQLPMVAFMHLPAFFMLQSASRGGHGGGAGFAVLLAFSLLIAAAFQRSLETLYNRGDLPFLLASPVPLRVVVATRLVDIALTTLAGSALFLIPLIDCAAILHGRQWLWSWPTWIATCGLIVPAALATTLTLVRRIGARRTRVVVQLFGLGIGMVAFVGFQASNWANRSGQNHAPHRADWMGWFDHPPLTFFADAARGDCVRLTLLFVAAAAALFFGLRRLARDFGQGALATGDDLGEPSPGRRGRANPWAGYFLRPAWQVVILKELRLVFRDPLLLARASTQIITIIPGLAGAFLYRASVGLAGVALVGPALATALLAALMTANDDAPEHPAVSPVSPRRVLAARTCAAAGPPALFGAIVAMIIVVLGHPVLGAVAAFGALLNATAIGWLTVCTVRSHTAEERARGKQPMIILQSLYGMLVGGLGAGAFGLAVAGQLVAAAILGGIALVAALLSFAKRPRKTWSVA